MGEMLRSKNRHSPDLDLRLLAADECEGYPLMYVVGLHMLDCSCLQDHLVLLGPCMYIYTANHTILYIIPLHCSFMLTYILFSSDVSN